MNNEDNSIDITITGLGHEGEGVGRTADLVVFVPGALPGEEISARITERKKSFCRGELVRIIKPSPLRITPPCPYAGVCGGCDLQHTGYQAQLAAKTQRVKDAISRIGRQDPALVAPCIGMGNPWEYRNNIQYTINAVQDGYRIGLLKKQSHDMVSVDRCLLVPEDMDHLVRETCRIILETLRRASSPTPFPVTRIQVRKSWASEKLLAIIYTDAIHLAHGEEIAKEITGAFPSCTGVVNFVRDDHDRVAQEILLSGENSIQEDLDGLSFTVQARSFFQVNTRQAATLYKLALSLAANGNPDLPGKQEPVSGAAAVDAFCGTGGLALFFARQGYAVTGIESNHAAVVDAICNSERNRLENVSFREGTFSAIFPGLVKSRKPGLLIVDPPRSGLGKDDISGIGRTTIEKIVYVSCDPGTLARDIVLLRNEGFTPETLVPVDMFPQTAHVETVALLTKKT